MKHIKKFEINKEEEKEKKEKEDLDLLRDLINENPLSVDNDFYIFIGRDGFKDAGKGLYKKSLEIENMVRISDNMNSIFAMKGLDMRSRLQSDSTLYHIWLPKELRSDIEGKGSNNIEDYMIDIIDKYKMRGTTDEGKRITREVKQRRKDIGKYNI